MSPDRRTPVLVGAAQLRSNRGRTVAGAREPLALILEALRTAAPGLLARADAVFAVHVASWDYDDLALQVATAVGARPRTTVNTGIGGHHPVRLLDRAAAAIWSGESEVALLVGAEAQASLGVIAAGGVDPRTLGWSASPGGPPPFDLDQLGSAGMQAAGLMFPTRVYPLLENRLQADLGLTSAQSHAWSSQLYADLSAVASLHSAAWNPEPRTPEEVGTTGPGNRMVCEPYPLAMNAMPHVDQAAAVVLTSLQVARDAGIEQSQLVFVWGGAGADDDPDVLRRPSLGSSVAIASALDRTLGQASRAIDDVDLLDVYSCFPVVPKLVGLHLGLPREQVLSVTGGHSSFGGPLSSYSLHAVVAMAEQLRGGSRLGMVHGNGGYLCYQHAVLLSGVPSAAGFVGAPEPVQVRHAEVPALVVVDGTLDVIVETATVEHDREGRPRQAFLVARTDDGSRVAGATRKGDLTQASQLSLAHLPAGRTTHVGRRLHVRDVDAALELEALD